MYRTESERCEVEFSAKLLDIYDDVAKSLREFSGYID